MVEPLWMPAGQQQIFRRLVEVIARPGRVAELARWLGGEPAAVGVLATLLDGTERLADEAGLLGERERRFLGAPVVSLDESTYALLPGHRPPPPGWSPRLGELVAPESAHTLVLQVARLGQGPQQLTLVGPGVDGVARLALDGLAHGWLARRSEWNRSFPLGIDLILTDASRVAALPRTTRVVKEPGA
jgi:alpha-D-ribose 1-methylphosphonate 5-triphosphate synthase subunit PhnH